MSQTFQKKREAWPLFRALQRLDDSSGSSQTVRVPKLWRSNSMYRLHTSHNDNDDKQQYKDQNQSTNKQSQNSKVKASMTNGQASSRIETRIHIIVECMHVCWIKHIQSQLNHTHVFAYILTILWNEYSWNLWILFTSFYINIVLQRKIMLIHPTQQISSSCPSGGIGRPLSPPEGMKIHEDLLAMIWNCMDLWWHQGVKTATLKGI